MNKPKSVKALEGVKEKPKENRNTTGKDILTSGVGAGLAVIGQNIAEKIGGVHNSDIKKQLDWYFFKCSEIKSLKLFSAIQAYTNWRLVYYINLNSLCSHY